MSKKRRKLSQPVTPPTISEDVLSHLCDQAIERALKALKDGHFKITEDLMRQIIEVGKDTPNTNHLLSLALHRQGLNFDAQEIMEAVTKECPDNWEYWNTLGVINSALKQHSLAATCFEQALALEPKSPVIKNNLGLEYHATNDLDSAYSILQESIKAANNEQKPMLFFNLANVLVDLHKTTDAIYYFDRARLSLPNFTAAAWNLSNAFLSVGDYRNGWREYESRWKQFPHFAHKKSQYMSRPELFHVDDRLDGQRVLLYCEQGAGDMIQFIRFAKELKKCGAYVMVSWDNQYVRGDMKSLLKTIRWVDEVIDPLEQKMFVDYDFDFHQSVASLPRILEVETNEELRSSTYITPDDRFAYELEEHHWLPYRKKFRIGLVWAGNPIHHRDQKRSLPFKELYDSFRRIDRHVQLFSLQKDNRPRIWPGGETVDLSAGLKESDVVDLSPMMIDFNATANVISQLDLVVSVDTAVVHLAGAMGKRTHLLLPYTPDWRWGLSKKDTPWYVSVRIFRQDEEQKWRDVIEASAQEAKFLARQVLRDRNPC